MAQVATDVEHDNTDPNGGFDGQHGYHEGTDYSLPYISQYSRVVHDGVTSSMLRHINCSYMGTAGHPTTLLALKQHAQSLAALISYLEPTVTSGRVDGFSQGDHDPNGYEVEGGVASGTPTAQASTGGETRNMYSTYTDLPSRRLDSGGAFDWLASLDTPYYNDDPNHHKPLNALLNEIHSHSDQHPTQTWCPLTYAPTRGTASDMEHYRQDFEPLVQKRPFANHVNLMMHANECLERLDHEFSATGGLLSLLPPAPDHDHDGDDNGGETADMVAARNSLLGQFLSHMQAMYIRMHEFEIEVGNMRDALAKDAVAPLQSMTQGGPDGSTARELVVSQERFVLVNANDATWEEMHDVFDKQEGQITTKEAIYREAGLSGERQWVAERGGDEYVGRGIVPVDFVTRYYRLRGTGHSTIFMSPAFGRVASTQQTPRNEGCEGIVGLVAPRWPVRVSAWEQRHQTEADGVARLRRERGELATRNGDLTRQVESLRQQLDAARLNMRGEVNTILNVAPPAVDGVEGEDQAPTDATVAQWQARFDQLMTRYRAATVATTAAERALRTATRAANANANNNNSSNNAEAVRNGFQAVMEALGRAVVAGGDSLNARGREALRQAIEVARTQAAVTTGGGGAAATGAATGTGTGTGAAQ